MMPHPSLGNSTNRDISDSCWDKLSNIEHPPDKELLAISPKMIWPISNWEVEDVQYYSCSVVDPLMLIWFPGKGNFGALGMWQQAFKTKYMIQLLTLGAC